jgi:hypothetical protein
MPRLTRFRAVPWLLLFDAARTVQAHLGEHLSPADRRRVTDIARRSKGDPRKVTPREREELRAIAGRLDLAALGRDLLPLGGRLGRGRRR